MGESAVGGAKDSRKTEICEFERPVGRDQKIVGLEILQEGRERERARFAISAGVLLFGGETSYSMQDPVLVAILDGTKQLFHVTLHGVPTKVSTRGDRERTWEGMGRSGQRTLMSAGERTISGDLMMASEARMQCRLGVAGKTEFRLAAVARTSEHAATHRGRSARTQTPGRWLRCG